MVQGTLEVGKLSIDDWDISGKQSEINIAYKDETVASVKAHEVKPVVADVKTPPPKLKRNRRGR